jgi:hypothetical protein
MLLSPARAAARRSPAATARSFAAAATAATAAAAPSKHMKRYVLLGSVGLSLLSSAPLVYYVKGLLEREVPPHAAGLKGTWVAATPDGSRWALVKVNAHGVSTGRALRRGGGVRWSVGPLPGAATPDVLSQPPRAPRPRRWRCTSPPTAPTSAGPSATRQTPSRSSQLSAGLARPRRCPSAAGRRRLRQRRRRGRRPAPPPPRPPRRRLGARGAGVGGGGGAAGRRSRCGARRDGGGCGFHAAGD